MDVSIPQRRRNVKRVEQKQDTVFTLYGRRSRGLFVLDDAYTYDIYADGRTVLCTTQILPDDATDEIPRTQTIERHLSPTRFRTLINKIADCLDNQTPVKKRPILTRIGYWMVWKDEMYTSSK